MREVIEFGSGRQARRSWDLHQIGIVPARRARSSKDVDVTWKFDAYDFELPIVGHPTDATMSPESIIKLGKLGGLGVLNAEGLWGRLEDPAAAIDEVIKTAEVDTVQVDGAANKVLQKYHSQPINEALLEARIKEIRDAGVTVAVRVSPQHARELAPLLVKAGVEILFIQGSLLSADYVDSNDSDGSSLDVASLVGELELPVVVGGVLDYSTALHLMRTGAAGVIVGPGSEELSSSYGIHVGMATAIADVAAARRDYLDETGGRYVHVIADVGSYSETTGDIARAIACGADAVALGSAFARTSDTPGKGWFWRAAAAHPKYPRSAVTFQIDMPPEAEDVPSLEQLLLGPTSMPWGTENLVGGLRRAMAKCGYTDLKSFQRVELTI